MPEARKCSSCGAELPAAAMTDNPSALCARCSPSGGKGTSTPAEEGSRTKTMVVSLPPTLFPPSEKPGDKIGRYKLLQQIGEGGCGVVYMADQEEPVKRRVALKVIKPGMDTKEVLGRFEAERQALALMDHPNIAKVLDAGATETGRPYFVMELVRGIPITRYCDENKLNTKQRLELFMLVCQAIQHAHQKGIIHRDIKPSNILVADHDGVPVPKIIDFGIAKATSGQTLTDKTVFTALEQFIGTPAYMSPEQAKMSGLDIDTRSDIYSLGVLLYELLTGKTPFDIKRLFEAGFDEIRRIIREEEPPRPSQKLSTLAAGEQTTTAQARQTDSPRLLHLVRGDLDWIVMKCLEKDRNRRYETATGLASDLERHINNEPVVARPPSKLYRFQKAWRRNKTVFAVATLIAVVLVAATGISAWQAVLAKRSLAESEAISKFLTEVFQIPNPSHAGHPITVTEMLGTATKSLETNLAIQPVHRMKLQASLGVTYAALGFYQDAIPLLEKVRDYQLAASGPENSNSLGVMQGLAFVYDHAGRRDEALTMMEKVLVVIRKVNGPENPDTLDAMHFVASLYDEAGRRNEALIMEEQVLAFRRKTSGPEDPNTLEAMQGLAVLYDQVGRRDEALTMLEKVLAVRHKVNAPEDADTVDAMSNLGAFYYEAGRWNEALKLREDVLAVRRKVHGPEHPGTLAALNDLASSYDQVGRRGEALKLREDVLALRRKVLGPEHPDTLMAMNNLAVSYAEAGRQDEALKLREEVLALRRKVNGSEHPDTLQAMNNLVDSYDTAGRWEEALKLAEETLALHRKVLGPKHPDTIRAMCNLAMCYADVGRRDEALKLREEVMALSRKVLGPEHPDTVRAMQGLADSYAEVGRRDEALKLREDGLASSRKVLGPEHPDTLDAMNNLARSYAEAGRSDEGLKLREEVLTLRRKVLGPEHPDSIVAMFNLSDSYDKANRQDEALKLREEVLALSRKVLGPEHPDTVRAMLPLATSYDETNRRDEALKLLEEMLPLSRKVIGPERPDTLSAMHNLANSYDEAGRRDEALKLREEVLPLRRKVNGPDHPDTIRAMFTLAGSYAEAGRWDEVAKLQEEMLAISRKVNGPEHPTTINSMYTLADSYCLVGRVQEAIALLSKACELAPSNSLALFRLATWQTWFGQDADYEATRRCMLQQAEGTEIAATAERAAKAYCLRPSTNTTLLTNVLNIAQLAVELGKNSRGLPWDQLALGLAEYRNGQYATAEQTLAVAEQTAGRYFDIQGTARLFRAMSLFRQGRQEEARKLFVQTEKEMTPLPVNENKPPLDGRSFNVDHDVLVCWLAYKEAKSLLNEPAAKP